MSCRMSLKERSAMTVCAGQKRWKGDSGLADPSLNALSRCGGCPAQSARVIPNMPFTRGEGEMAGFLLNAHNSSFRLACAVSR